MSIHVAKVIGWAVRCMFLMSALGFGVVCYGQTEIIKAAGTAAEIARDKDIVTLSLMTAIAAILVTAWLVKIMITQQAKAIEALSEMSKRPCLMDMKKEAHT